MNPPVYIAIAANGIAFIQMAIDKHLAKKGKRRIPEAQLIAPTLLGGIGGTVLGMLAFRHKTKKQSFQIKLLATFIIWLLSVYFIANR
jgi:uncharacterized membrane protein YsdA (DUF1294 family)